MFIKVIMRLTTEKVMGKCFGAMEVSIKVNGKQENKKEREHYIHHNKEQRKECLAIICLLRSMISLRE